jgi:ectoine hydroxylase-related dioxygenase (phytanoyl-CoA dioxygenase family)
MKAPIKEYGVSNRNELQSEIDRILEEIRINGYCVIPDVVEESYLEEARKRLDAVYLEQEKAFGKEKLIAIQELDVARCPLAYDEFFLQMAGNSLVLQVAKAMIGGMQILHLQNGIINRPGEEHHQSSWHRDLPYQDWVISKPLAMNALWCLDPFNSETGATWILPYSHQQALLPSLDYTNKFKIQISAEAGSVVLFDSMMFHCAGYNKSEIVRRAINHVYVTPILRQQIDIPASLQGKHKDSAYAELLGYTTLLPQSVDQFRENRYNRLKK